MLRVKYNTGNVYNLRLVTLCTRIYKYTERLLRRILQYKKNKIIITAFLNLFSLFIGEGKL